MTNSTRAPNRLINEKSPYLLQHAYNPVDWWPWCDEAFAKARRENKPVFLSIGYSTCHWCHVMERESFEDSEVAKALSDDFIAIKVDREERPDVDNIYMNACHMITGSGGWPLSIFLNCDRKPFFAGTYFPKSSFLSLLSQIGSLWKHRRDDLEAQAEKLLTAINEDDLSGGDIDFSIPQKAFSTLSKSFDDVYGGFGTAPKFPSPHILMFLMRYCARDKAALPIIEKTLDAYRNGGLFDQIGFGFYRYSTDRQLHIPHFEKMLYDNALLCLAYAEGFALTGKRRFAQTVKEIIHYLCRDLRSPEGGFYTAEDADSEGEEGRFYVFGRDEIESVLHEDAGEFIRIFPASQQGNFDGKNHLFLADRQLYEQHEELIGLSREKLLAYRNFRERPMRDEKILTAQNGMALSALAVAGRVLEDPSIIRLARETEGFIQENLTDSQGRLLSSVIGGARGVPGFAEDYVFYIYGLLELYFATGDDLYRQRAAKFNEIFLSDFASPDGGFYQTGKDAEKLIARPRDIYDGAVPSANAVAVNNLLRLSRLQYDEGLLKMAQDTVKTFMGTISASPASYCFSAINLMMLSKSGADIVLSGKSLGELQELRRAIPYFNCATIKTLIGENTDYPMISGVPTAYVCAGGQCYPPVSGTDALRELMMRI